MLSELVRIATVGALTAALTSPAGAQSSRETPENRPSSVAACRANSSGKVDYQACADAAPKGSPDRSWALINLGTEAFLRYDWKEAVRLYDEGRPPEQQKLYSDATFHAFRGASYAHVGRRAEALQDAHIAWLILDHQANPDLPPELQTFPVGPAQPSDLFPLILPILKEGQSRDFAPALAAFRALPATDWIALSNRAATMKDIGDIPSAYADSREALRLAPNEPAVLNNLCELFADDGKAKDGMAYCQRAVALAPQMAPVYDSYAAALVGVGRCEDAKAELAKAHRLDPVSVTYQRTLDCKSAK